MGKFRLSNFPYTSSDYLALFKEEKVAIQPYRKGGNYKIVNGELVASPEGGMNLMTQEEHGLIKIDTGEIQFDIELGSSMGVVDPELIGVAKEVLSQIVELDSAARLLPSDIDYEEYLLFIKISRSEVELHYVSDTVNTSWGVFFERDERGRFHTKKTG